MSAADPPQPVVDVEALRAKYADYALARDLTAQQGFSPSLQEQGTPAALAARALERAAEAAAAEAAAAAAAAAAAGAGVGAGADAAAAAAAATAANSAAAAAAHAPRAGASRLDRMTICAPCRGLGVRKVEYNFYVRDATCGDCDGEGTILAPERPAAAAAVAAVAAVAADGEDAEDAPPLEDAR